MLSLNPNRQITKGFLRASIIDKKGDFRLIPLSLIDYCSSLLLDNNNEEPNKEYQKFLESQNLFLENAIELNNTWDTFAKIRHLSVKLKNINLIDKIVEFVHVNLCDSIDFIVDPVVRQDELINLLETISKKVYCRFSFQLSYTNLNEKLLDKINETVNLREVYLETFNEKNKNINEFRFDKIFILDKSIDLKFHSITLNPHPDLIIESKYHHTYFNKRAHIDIDGNISRFLGDSEKFGHLNDFKTFNEFLLIADFNYYWSAKKESCDVCKDCEFRHVCVDFRIPVKRKDKEWFHKGECNYNPYIGKWEGQEGYLSLADVGVISNNKSFEIDESKIGKINKTLWVD